MNENKMIGTDIIEVKRTYNGYVCIRHSYKSENQEYAFMVIKEYYNHNGIIEYAKILFYIK